MSSRQKTSGGGSLAKNCEVVLACVVFLVVYLDPRARCGNRDRFQGFSLVHSQPLHYPTKTLVLHHQLSPSTSPLRDAPPGECADMCTCVRLRQREKVLGYV
jgi:hypothetical protein